MNREHKTGSMSWLLHFTCTLPISSRRFVYYINTDGSFLMTLANKNQLKSDRQTTLWRWLCFVHLFLCFWFVLFIICWYLHVFKQRWTAAIIVENDHFVFDEFWRTKKIDWSMADCRYEVYQFWGVDFETHQDDVWDASSLLFQMVLTFWSTNLWHSIWSWKCAFNIVSTFDVCTAGLLLP